MRTYYRQKYISHQQYAENLCLNVTRWLKRKSRRLKEQWLDAALILMKLDLEPAKPLLESLYSPDPRGQKPFEPVRMLRALLLMILLGYASIAKFAQDLKANPRLAIIAGFEPLDTPVTGSFYHFIDPRVRGDWKMALTRSLANTLSNKANLEKASI